MGWGQLIRGEMGYFSFSLKKKTYWLCTCNLVISHMWISVQKSERREWFPSASTVSNPLLMCYNTSMSSTGLHSNTWQTAAVVWVIVSDCFFSLGRGRWEPEGFRLQQRNHRSSQNLMCTRPTWGILCAGRHTGDVRATLPPLTKMQHTPVFPSVV